MVMTEEAEKKQGYQPIDPGLSVDQVAAELGCDRSSARRLIISSIPHYIVAAGRRKKSYRVRRSVLMRWRESQERQSMKRKPAALSVVNAEQTD
jgi:helix-turn-helix protein